MGRASFGRIHSGIKVAAAVKFVCARQSSAFSCHAGRISRAWARDEGGVWRVESVELHRPSQTAIFLLLEAIGIRHTQRPSWRPFCSPGYENGRPEPPTRARAIAIPCPAPLERGETLCFRAGMASGLGPQATPHPIRTPRPIAAARLVWCRLVWCRPGGRGSGGRSSGRLISGRHGSGWQHPDRPGPNIRVTGRKVAVTRSEPSWRDVV